MMSFPRSRAVLLLASAVLASVAAAQTPASEAARRVLQALDRIQAESLSSSPAARLRRSDFTEADVNAYIAYRLAEEKEDVLKELKLKLRDENKVEGMALVDLTGRKIPTFIKPRMNLYFEGLLVVQGPKARFDVRRLFLEGQEIPLFILDALIDIALKLGKADAESIRAWVDLPYGIKDLKTRPGGLALFY